MVGGRPFGRPPTAPVSLGWPARRPPQPCGPATGRMCVVPDPCRVPPTLGAPRSTRGRRRPAGAVARLHPSVVRTLPRCRRSSRAVVTRSALEVDERPERRSRPLVSHQRRSPASLARRVARCRLDERRHSPFLGRPSPLGLGPGLASGKPYWLSASAGSPRCLPGVELDGSRLRDGCAPSWLGWCAEGA